jgi:putative ABC transport system ATP-binding protein
VAEPALVLADEPTANVDSRTAAALLDLMARLNQERQATFLFSTHDRNVMERSRRLIVLRDGMIDKNGSADNLDDD